MIVNLPRSDQALMKVTAKARNWSKHLFMGRPFRVCEIEIPAGIAIDDVEVIAEACNRNGEAVESAVILRTPKIKPIAPVIETEIPVQETQETLPKAKKKRTKRNQEIAPTAELVDEDESQGSATGNELG